MTKSILVLPDSHAHPDFHNKRFEWAAKLVLDIKPDYVVNLGDMYDMPSLSSYDKGKKSFEGRRYKRDIDAGIDANERYWNILKAPKKKLPKHFFTYGNHECVSPDTEILTDNGWIRADEISIDTKIANKINNKLEYLKPVAVSSTFDTGFILSGDMHDERVSFKHNVIIDGNRVPVSTIETKTKQTKFSYALHLNKSSSLTEDEVRLLVWAVSNSTYVLGPGNKRRVQWKLSKQRKIERLESLLLRMGLKYTKRPAAMTGINKLQPYYICCYGDEARAVMKLTGEVK